MKTVIVTGASGNLGQSVIQKFLQEGFRVIGTVIPNDPVKLEIQHTAFESRVVDLMNEEDAQKFVATVASEKQSIDVAVLTVGGFAMGKIAETSSADINKQIKLNFETAYHVAKPVFIQMIKQGSGKIFLVGSKPGLDARNSKGMVAYGLAKSLVFRLAELMNEEAKNTNVVTHVIVPSTNDTPQNRKSMPDADFSKWVKPEAIADIIHFYSSPGSSPLREPVLKVYGNA
ncbi:MAG TPA: SDR family NAD(P)-dependent oxidoreductase [Chitinophagaceae bacterium]|nr:SDR family NAD(P)-dependent oxidoreductase [Chitinophagaceae bacterium]